ncbi:MAG: PAS domain S-box protein [Gammaproteobacteria bacterium]|nr:MAG: PAS domain S-box protein [Gammaproteobacteria bacterium]
MKNRVTPTDHEVRLQPDHFIVSKTDLKGRITYANRVFMHISGYREDELLGAQHNIIRHPDMPRGVFLLLWNMIQNGEECFAYVKNLCKNGDYYWVFANVTVDYDAAGQPSGYFSVRRKPEQSAIDTVTPLYREMLRIEQEAGPANAPRASLEWLQAQLAEQRKDYNAFILSL